MYPRLVVDLDKFEHNARTLIEMGARHGIALAAVTKSFCAESKMVEILANLPFEFLADSRLENFENYPETRHAKTLLLRLPQPSDVERTVKTCDISLNSELFTLRLLAKAAKKAGLRHGIILMIDLGDLREGVYFKNEHLLFETVDFVAGDESLYLEGIGTNLTCYGSVLPTMDNLQQLCDLAKTIEKRIGKKLNIISGGNSSSLYLLKKGKIPARVNNLRLGEAIIRGVETAYGLPFIGLEQNVVTLEAEVIEMMEKPSMPEGILGINAFGEKPIYEDRGITKRAILAVGRQDTDCNGLECEGISVIGASSDHLIAEGDLKLGEIVSFNLTYGAILAAFTSKYVGKSFKYKI
ncbi:MAG: alanine/ornithine racemase family PLP-dependent enzyme [Turicibacter sp.]|nr:alanine/ornithine racemase family PLP-dependent enzyme [Turicibacter sp.]